MAISGKTRFSH